MPYKVEKCDDEWCVVDDEGSVVEGGRHDTKAKAEAHKRALYANVEDADKGQEEKAFLAASDPGSVMRPPTSFAELDEIDRAAEVADQVHYLTEQYHMLVDNVMRSPFVDDRKEAIATLSDEFAARLDEATDGETKEIAEKAKWSTEYINDLPDSAFLYIEPGGEKDDEGKTTPRSLRHLPYKNDKGNVDLPHLRNALSRLGQEETGKDWLSASLRKKLRKKAEGILERETKENLLPRIWDAVKSWFGSTEVADEEESEEKESKPVPFFTWKGKDGQWQWMARYSNNLRDDDNPPEIIASQSHRRFVERVDKGLEPLPELWLWHRPEWKWGEAVWVAYDDAGWAMAAGTVDKGCEWLAEVVANQAAEGNVRTSHGMPHDSIARSKEDDSVIIQHATREISPLPSWAAANKWTEFVTYGADYKEADSMNEEKGIAAAKREELVGQWGVPEDALTALEARNREDAEKARQQMIEAKEADTEEAAVEDTSEEESAENKDAADTEAESQSATKDEVESAEESVEAETESTVPAELQGVSADQIAAAVGEAIAPFMSEMQKAVAEVRDEINQVKARQSEAEEAAAVKEVVEGAPAASLVSLIQKSIVSHTSGRAVGSDKARVDGRTSLAKQGPKEAPPEATMGMPPVIQSLMQGHDLADVFNKE